MKRKMIKLLTWLISLLTNKEIEAGTLTSPKIDIDSIQKSANEAAEKAYLGQIRSYYIDYDSPYKKMISNELEKQSFSYPLNLPDIMATINENLLNEVDKIANQAVAMSFVPMVADMFLKCKKHIKISEILKEIVEEIEPKRRDFENFAFSYKESRKHNWLDCVLTTPNNCYEFTLFEKKDYEKGEFIGLGEFQLLNFPRELHQKGYTSNMTILKDDIKIEMPFTPGILKDKVLKLFFKYMLSNCGIEMDVKEFHEDMFPQDEVDY